MTGLSITETRTYFSDLTYTFKQWPTEDGLGAHYELYWNTKEAKGIRFTIPTLPPIGLAHPALDWGNLLYSQTVRQSINPNEFNPLHLKPLQEGKQFFACLPKGFGEANQTCREFAVQSGLQLVEDDHHLTIAAPVQTREVLMDIDTFYHVLTELLIDEESLPSKEDFLAEWALAWSGDFITLVEAFWAKNGGGHQTYDKVIKSLLERMPLESYLITDVERFTAEATLASKPTRRQWDIETLRFPLAVLLLVVGGIGTLSPNHSYRVAGVICSLVTLGACILSYPETRSFLKSKCQVKKKLKR